MAISYLTLATSLLIIQALCIWPDAAGDHFKVINGVMASLGMYPSVVMIYSTTNGTMCTGTILDRNVVLSAAHCGCGARMTNVFPGILSSKVVIPQANWLTVADYKLTDDAADKCSRGESLMGGSDLSMFRIKGNFTTGPNIAYGQLTSTNNGSSDNLTIVGFGLNEKAISGILLHGTYTTMQSCPGNIPNADMAVCYDVTKNNQSADHGDSGGPSFDSAGNVVAVTSGSQANSWSVTYSNGTQVNNSTNIGVMVSVLHPTNMNFIQKTWASFKNFT